MLLSNLKKGEDKICGLVGVAGDLRKVDKDMFIQLLIIDQLRGNHSTGAAFVNNWNDQVNVVKALGTPENLFENKNFDTHCTAAAKVMLGHNRFATKGSISKNNAHPFEFDNVVGAHNGTLTHFSNLPDHKDFAVDSQALYNSISVQGVEKTLRNVRGAYALTFWDKRDKTLNFIRNNERTLFIAIYNEGKNIAWASEEEMLDLVLTRNNVVPNEIFMLKRDVLLSYDLSKSSRKQLEAIVCDLEGGTELNTSVVPFQSPNTSTKDSPDYTKMKLRDAKFRVGLTGMTPHGASYVNCHSLADDATYRLYINPNQKDVNDLRFGQMFTADTNGMEYVGTTIVYRILASSVMPCAIDRNEDDGVITSKITDKEEGDLFLNPKGVYLTRSAWLKDHGTCSFCSADVDPDLAWEFYKDGILCDSCHDNPVVKDYLCGETSIQ